MTMTDDLRQAIAAGRRQARTIKACLEALATRKRGRPVTAESLTRKVNTLSRRIEDETNPLARITLIQHRLDAEAALASIDQLNDLASLQAGFLAEAAAYSGRKGLSYAAWRAAGVTAAVLREADVLRTHRG